MLNSKGKVYYGMHFYPGVAEYQEPGKEPYRVFLNEDTIRSMDPSFAGRPVFVRHVDGVDDDIDEVRKDADGWVAESFYNQADGKHWAKFIVVSEKGEQAIARGWCLSNCYMPKNFGKGGLWNGVSYAKEVTGGEYEHLAIVPDPRYEESVILSPDQFKAYNEEKLVELKRLANQKDESTVKINFFKRAKVENSADLEGVCVTLPKSGKEMTITQLVNSMDEHEEKAKGPQIANGEHHVKVGDETMTVNELVDRHMKMCDALAEAKKNDDADGDGDDGATENADDAEELGEGEATAKKNALDAARIKKDADDAAAAAAKAKAKVKADRVRNAGAENEAPETAVVEFSATQVARGKARYGS